MHSFIEAARRIYQEAREGGRLREGLSLEQIKALALRQEGVVRTQFGSLAADTEPMNRSAPHTKNSIDDQFGEEEDKLAHQAVEVMGNENLVSLDALVGDGKDGITVRLMMPEKYCQIAYALKLLFGEPPGGVLETPTYQILFFTDGAFELNKPKKLENKDLSVRSYMGDSVGKQVKICRNTTYTGEGKKWVFMCEDWRVKALAKTGIFLHMGARSDRLWVYEDGWELRDIVTAIGGLTATGKTSSTNRSFVRYPEEVSQMISDDGGEFNFNGSFAGFELGGVYIKTDGLNEEEQPELYRAATAREAFLENVQLSQYPYIPDFDDVSKTSNGRAIVSRANIEIASESIRADRVDNIIILTRNPLVNVISKLTREQAVMQMIYGESVESSGGDPSKAGQFKREFFLDPFVAGDLLEHAMIFYEFLVRNPYINCYLANTDVIGQERVIRDAEMYKRVVEKDPELLESYDALGLALRAHEDGVVSFVRNVSLRQSLAAYNDVVRGSIKFSTGVDHLGYSRVVQCDRLTRSVAVANDLFPDKELLKARVDDFLQGRRQYLEEFEGKWGPILPSIRNSLPPYSNNV